MIFKEFIQLLCFITITQGIKQDGLSTNRMKTTTPLLTIVSDSESAVQTSSSQTKKIENDKTDKWMNQGDHRKKTINFEPVDNVEVFGKKDIQLDSGDDNRVDVTEVNTLVNGDRVYLERLADWGLGQGKYPGDKAFWSAGSRESKLSSYWTEVNMTANASNVIPQFSGKNVELLNPLKGFLNKVMKSFWSERMMQQKQPICDFSSGSYLNLCGECVGGKTEKEGSYGVDGCGVCDGTCPKTNAEACSAEEVLNCSRVERVDPGVLDLASDVSEGFIVKLGSECPGACVVPPQDQLDCFLATHDDKILDKKTVNIPEDETTFRIQLSNPDREGSYKLCCGEDNAWCKPVVVVDSNRLIVNIKEADLRLSKESKVILSVSNLEAPIGLICFVKAGNHLLQAKFTNELYGNKYNTRVVCPSFAPDTLSDLNIGVAYSFRAIDKLTGVTMKVSADSPKMVKVTVRPDLSGMRVEFDQNIAIRPNQSSKVANSKITAISSRNNTIIGDEVDCAGIFTKESLATFGKGPKCRVFLNIVSVDFGKRPKLSRGMKVILTRKNILMPGDVTFADATRQEVNIPRALSADLMKLALPKHIIKGGGKVIVDDTCGGSFRAAVIPPQEGIVYKWSLTIGRNTGQPVSIMNNRTKRSTHQISYTKRSNLDFATGASLNNESKIGAKINFYNTTKPTSKSIKNIAETTKNNTVKLNSHIITNTGSETKNTINKMVTKNEKIGTNSGVKTYQHNNETLRAEKELNRTKDNENKITFKTKNRRRSQENETIITSIEDNTNIIVNSGVKSLEDYKNKEFNKSRNTDNIKINEKHLKLLNNNVLNKTELNITASVSQIITNSTMLPPKIHLSQIELPKHSQELIDEGIVKILENEQHKTTNSFNVLHKDAMSILNEVNHFNDDKKFEGKERDSVDVELVKRFGNSELSGGQKHRKNLLLWKSVREVEKMIKQGEDVVYIDKKLLLPDVEYLVKAEALVQDDIDIDVEPREAKLVSLGQSPGIWREKIKNHVLNIMGPPVVNPLAGLVLQARTDDCTHSPTSAYRYEWKVEGKGKTFPTQGFRGSTLKIKRGSLLPNTEYNVTAILYNALDSPAAWGTTTIYSDGGKLFEKLPIKEISIGTRHPIIIDARDYLPSDFNNIQIEWTCKTIDDGDCVRAGPERKILTKQIGYVLVYPKGTLPVGQYKITGKCIWEKEEVWSSEVLVTVVRGETPNLELSLGESGWTAKISQAKPGCFLSWNPIPTSGCQTIHSKDLGQKLVGIDNEAEVILGIEKYVKSGSCYTLEVAAECREGKAKVRVFVESTEHPQISLKVTPKSGQAISTKFEYEVIHSTFSRSYEYKFGYENDKGRRLLHSSVDDPKFYTYLPTGNEITAFVEMCSSDDKCLTAFSDKIKVVMPSKISRPAIDDIILTFEDEIKSRYYETSLGNLLLINEALGDSKDLRDMKNATLAVEYVLANAMFDTSARLNNSDEQIWGAKLLELTTSVPFLPVTDKFTTIMLDFRDRLTAELNNASIPRHPHSTTIGTPSISSSTTKFLETKPSQDQTKGTTPTTYISTTMKRDTETVLTTISNEITSSATKLVPNPTTVVPKGTSKISNTSIQEKSTTESITNTSIDEEIETTAGTSTIKISVTTNSSINKISATTDSSKTTKLNDIAKTTLTSTQVSIQNSARPATETSKPDKTEDITKDDTNESVSSSTLIVNHESKSPELLTEATASTESTTPTSVEKVRKKRNVDGANKDDIPMRFRRDTESRNNIISTLMKTTQLVILSSKNKSQIAVEKNKFTSNIPTYGLELCNGADTNANPTIAESKIAILSGEKLQLTGQKYEMAVPPCTATCNNETMQVLLSKQLLDLYKGQDGICLAGSYFQQDLLESNINSSSKTRASGIYRIDIMSYKDQLITNNQINITKKLITIRVPVRITPNQQKATYQCEQWNATDSKWTNRECKTVKLKTMKGITKAVCRCLWPGYYRVVALKKLMNESKLIMNESIVTEVESVQLYTLRFELKNDYSREVYGRKIEFENMLKKQISSQADIPEESEIYTENQGNIVVVLRAVDKWVDSETHFVRVLSKKLTTGKLRLTGFSGSVLTLDVMSFNYTHVPIGDKMAPPILLTMVTTIFTVVFLVAAFIALGAYIHWRKDIRTLNVSSKPFDRSPKQRYSRLHDVASIENIEQALMKGRTNVDSGLILSVSGVKQFDHDLLHCNEIDLPIAHPH